MPVATITLPGGELRCLGRKRPMARAVCPRLAAYLDPASAAPPVKVDYYAKAMPAIRHVYLNDRYGDCVIAGKAHQVGLWTGNDGAAPVEATDREISDIYFRFSPRDEGCVITQVLDYFRDRGLIFGGQAHKIDGYVSVDWTNKVEVQVAIDVFGSLTIGVNLPDSWGSTRDGDLWDVTNSDIVGGHDVCCVGYDETGVQIATWGGLRTIIWAAFTSKRWVEECFAQLSPDWYGSDKLAPNGIDAATLKADLDKLGGGTIPPPDPPVPPKPPEPHVLNLTLSGKVAGILPVTLTGIATEGPVHSMQAGLGVFDLLRFLREYGPVVLALWSRYGPVAWQVLALLRGPEFAALSTVKKIEWAVLAIEAILAGSPLPALPT